MILVLLDDSYAEVAETCSCDMQIYFVYLTVFVLYSSSKVKVVALRDLRLTVG
jgi:hypothetical protein